MIPIMREPTGLIIIPLRTEPPPPAAAVEAPSALGSPTPPPSSRNPGSWDPGPPAGCLEIDSLEFRTSLSPQLRHIRAKFPLESETALPYNPLHE